MPRTMPPMKRPPDKQSIMANPSGSPYGMSERNDVANNTNFDVFCQHCDSGCRYIARRLNIESSEVMFVGENSIKTLFFTDSPLVHMFHIGLVELVGDRKNGC